MIGYRWKYGNVCSRVILITRTLPKKIESAYLIFLHQNVDDKEKRCDVERHRTKEKGGFSVGVPPLTIPNREVKPYCADGTAARWESRSPPIFLKTPRDPCGVFL